MSTRTLHPFSRRQWLVSSGAALAGLALSSRFLNDELRAQVSPERLAATKPVKARLSLNENPFGPSPKALDAMLRNLTGGKACRYPYGELNDLLNMIAAKEGVTPAHIVLGVGSGEILETVGMQFGLLKGEVVHATPGYTQLVRSAETAGGKAVGVPLNARLEHDLDAIASKVGAQTSVVYIANPNNPTGTTVEASALKEFVKSVSARTFVFVDEAYLDIADDYAGRTVVGLVNDSRNLLVARTFSKIFGLAGLRMGYGVTNPKFAAQLRNYGLGTITGPGIAAAMASLQDAGYIESTRAKIVAERAKLLGLLRELGKTYAEPQANFVFFQTGRPHKEVFDLMMAESVAIARPFPPMLDWARISIGLPEENDLARAALRKVLAT
ncbi:MAG: hypothetical protein JWM88_1316 [Verrucomicrobia bacterium]|nr:hypothetical protein [Verrucomicrobiota bacterium]